MCEGSLSHLFSVDKTVVRVDIVKIGPYTLVCCPGIESFDMFISKIQMKTSLSSPSAVVFCRFFML